MSVQKQGDAVAIVGSRLFTNYELLRGTILKDYPDAKGIRCIVSGGAKGADTLAERFAKEYSLELQVYLPYWDLHGGSAGAIRNKQIVDSADVVYAFLAKNYDSRGTKITIKMAKSAGKRVIEIDENKIEK